jgi:hypothetical protein
MVVLLYNIYLKLNPKRGRGYPQAEERALKSSSKLVNGPEFLLTADRLYYVYTLRVDKLAPLD